MPVVDPGYYMFIGSGSISSTPVAVQAVATSMTNFFVAQGSPNYANLAAIEYI